MREGVLERRGPGIIGKWEPKWFRIEGSTLICFPLEEGGGGSHGAAEGSTSLREVSKLAVESDKCECTFVQTDGAKIRLRAKTVQDVQAWFSSLLAGQSWEQSEEPPPADQGEQGPLFDRVWPGDEQAPEARGPPGAHGSPLQRPPAADRCAGSLRRSRSCDGERRQQAREPGGASAPQSPQAPGRVLRLHALHEAKQRRLESQRLRLQAEEMQRIAEEREAMKKGTRGHLDPASLNPQEAAQRLFKDHEQAEQRLARLQLRMEEEERQRLQETRFRRGQARAPADANAGVRLYEDHRRREQEKQAKKAERLEETQASEKSVIRSTGTSGTSYHEKLYDDAQHRREQLDKKMKERDAAEAKKFAEEAIFQRTGPVDMSCIVKLHGDHEAKLKKQALKMAQKQEKERQELEEAMRSGHTRGPSTSQQEPIWQRGKSAYFRGTDGRATAEAAGKRSSPELATPVDVAIAAVAQAVQWRINDRSGQGASDLKALAAPLRAMLNLYSEAQSSCEKGDGFPALCVRAPQRLFRDCCLLPEFEGFEQCREPNPIHQVEEDLDDLMRTAAKAQVALQELFVPPPHGTEWRSGTSRTNVAGARQALFAFSSGPKARSAAELKARVLFQPAEGARRRRHLLDLARLTLVFANCDLLHAALDEIIGKLEVVRVCNHFSAPTRLGERFVEVYIVVTLKANDGLSTPHVCELRLEESSYYQARELAAPHLEDFDRLFRTMFFRPNRDMDALAYLARAMLASAPEQHHLRSFRRHLTQTYGSAAVAWRRLGGTRLMPFERFRELCHSLKCREYAPLLWSALDPGCGGCISLFELAPEAVSLLARLRAHIMALAQTDDPDDQALFERLTLGSVAAEATGRIEGHDFGGILKAFNFSPEEATRLFRHLDYQAGSLSKPASSVSAADIGWLGRLSALVDLDAVLLCSESALSDHQALGQLTRTGSRPRTRRIGGVPGLKRNSKFALRAGEGPAPRSKSVEPAPRTARESLSPADGGVSIGQGLAQAGAGHQQGRREGSIGLGGATLQSASQSIRVSASANALHDGRGSLRSSSARGASPRGSLCTTHSPSAATTRSAASSPVVSPAGAIGRPSVGLPAPDDGLRECDEPASAMTGGAIWASLQEGSVDEALRDAAWPMAAADAPPEASKPPHQQAEEARAGVHGGEEASGAVDGGEGDAAPGPEATLDCGAGAACGDADDDYNVDDEDGGGPEATLDCGAGVACGDADDDYNVDDEDGGNALRSSEAAPACGVDVERGEEEDDCSADEGGGGAAVLGSEAALGEVEDYIEECF